MAGNPLINQGTLNRIIGAVQFVSNPQLNVTAPFLSRQGIRLALEGQSTVYLPTMTGAVTSGEPYMMVSCNVALLKSQNLSNLFKTQMEQLSTIGDFKVLPDTTSLGSYYINNGAIESVREMSFGGDDPSWMVTLKGYYQINATLYDVL